MEYFQGGIEVELTSHDGPIVSRTMPQDFEYRAPGESSPRRNYNDSKHHPRRSYDGNLSTAIPVKRLMSFGGKDSESMLDGEAIETPAVWDAPPAQMGDWEDSPAPPNSGIEKENESSRYLRSYERRPAPSALSSMHSLMKSNDDDSCNTSYSHSELDEEASDVSSSAMGSIRRRNRISQIHAEKLLIRQQREGLDKKKKKPLSSKTSINEVQPKHSNLKTAPKNVSFGAKSQESKATVFPGMDTKRDLVKTAKSLFKDSDSSSTGTEEKKYLPLVTKSDYPSSSSVITPSVNSNSPDRSVATNWTFSTGGSGRAYRTQIICSGKYKGRVTDKILSIHPDDLQVGRLLEGLENGFTEKEEFAHALISALFDMDMKKEPLHKLKQWEMSKSTLLRLERKPQGTGEGLSEVTETDTEALEELGNGNKAEEEEEDIVSPPSSTKLTAASSNTVKPSSSPKDSGDVQFEAEKTASLQFKDVFGMASAKGIIHFYEDRDEIWIEDYNFCFASRRFKFLSG